jgi:hypothetical protein
MAELIVDDLRAVYGISAGTGASSSAGVRKNVETSERAFVVLLYLCGPKAIGMKLWPSLQPNGLISRATPVP